MGLATYSYNRSTSGGEIIRELVNASDGQGLHFDGVAGAVTFTPPDLGTKLSLEFILQADSVSGGDQLIVDFGTGGRLIFGIDGGTDKLSILSGDWESFGVLIIDDLKVHHLVVTVDGTEAILYDNGNEVGTAPPITSPDVDLCTTASIGSENDGTGKHFNGTIYRARLWNKTLSQPEVTATYENATVPTIDRYGSAASKITGAVDKNWGTAQADSGNDATDRGTFNTNYDWVTEGIITDISVASNVLQFTSAASGTTGIFYPTPLVAGKRYRITIATGTITGGAFGFKLWDGDWVDVETLAASTTNVIDFVAPKSVHNYIYISSTDAGATIQLNAASVSTELVAVGCVADYDLAFANPTQSLLVQNRAADGASPVADGTASAGVTQVTPIEQLNSKSARIGTSAATPADGELLLDTFTASSASDTRCKINTSGTGSNAGLIINNSGDGDNSWMIRRHGAGNFQILHSTGEYPAGTVTVPFVIDNAGDVSLTGQLNVQGADAGTVASFYGATGTNTRGLKISLATDGVTNNVVKFDALHSAGILAFETGGNEAMRIDSAGLCSFSAGINLGNTASAELATLDGYLEGTFVVTNDGDASGTFTSESGEYTRIGNCVFVRAVIQVGVTFTSNKIGGLPYNCVCDAPSSWQPLGVALTGTTTDQPIAASAANGAATVTFFSGGSQGSAHAPVGGQYYRVNGFYYTTDAF